MEGEDSLPHRFGGVERGEVPALELGRHLEEPAHRRDAMLQAFDGDEGRNLRGDLDQSVGTGDRAQGTRFEREPDLGEALDALVHLAHQGNELVRELLLQINCGHLVPPGHRPVGIERNC